MSELGKESLRERIEQNKGAIRIFVRPFYEEIDGRAEKHEKRLESINQALTKLLLLPPDKTPPLIFLKNKMKLKSLRTGLEHRAAC